MQLLSMTTTQTTTMATLVSYAFGHDGQRFTSRFGDDLDAACAMGADEPEYRDGHGTDTRRYIWPDGSCIVVTDECWDIRADGCDEYCMREGRCQCGVS